MNRKLALEQITAARKVVGAESLANQRLSSSTKANYQ
jgi:hypothetical protein